MIICHIYHSSSSSPLFTSSLLWSQQPPPLGQGGSLVNNYSSLILIAHHRHSHFSRPPFRSTRSEDIVTPVNTPPPPPHSSTPERDPKHLLPPTPKRWPPCTCIVPWGLIGAMCPYCAHTQWQWESHVGVNRPGVSLGPAAEWVYLGVRTTT